MSQLPTEQRENIGKAIGVSVNPKISHSIALAGLARHYFGSGVPMAIGGVIGYLLGSTAFIDPNHKHKIINDIISSQNKLREETENQFNEQNPNERGIMSSTDLVNHTYSKYNFREFISSYLCFDINPWLEISEVVNNLKLSNNFISFIHTKRYNPDLHDGKKINDLKTEDYELMFEALQERETRESKINITSFEKQPDLDIIRFSLNGDFDSNVVLSDILTIVKATPTILLPYPQINLNIPHLNLF